MDSTPTAPVAIPQNKLVSWFRQPTTIQGLATLTFAAAGLVLHKFDAHTAEAMAAGAAILIGIPDNTGFLHRLAGEAQSA